MAFKANYNSKVDHYKAIVDRIEWGNYYGYDHDQAEKAKALYEENDPNYKEERKTKEPYDTNLKF